MGFPRYPWRLRQGQRRGPCGRPGVWCCCAWPMTPVNGFQRPCGTGRRIAIYRKVALNDGHKLLWPPALRGVRSGGQAGMKRVSKQFQSATRIAH